MTKLSPDEPSSAKLSWVPALVGGVGTDGLALGHSAYEVTSEKLGIESQGFGYCQAQKLATSENVNLEVSNDDHGPKRAQLKRNMIKYTDTVNKVSADDIALKDVTTYENSELFNYNLKPISQESSSQSHLPDMCELSTKPKINSDARTLSQPSNSQNPHHCIAPEMHPLQVVYTAWGKGANWGPTITGGMAKK